jgi:CRISPR-associated protein Cas1
MNEPILPPLKPLPIKERLSILFVERGQLDVLDGAFVLVDKNGVRQHIPVGCVVCLLLEPGTRVSHAAVTLAARVGCLLSWVGEGGVDCILQATRERGQSGCLYQLGLALDDAARLKDVRKMYEMRFQEKPPEKRSIQQLRGIEGARVRKMYGLLAKQYRVRWDARNYDHTAWGSGDVSNRCLSAATACLYGICEAGILAAGYAPAVGFIHTGKPQSFVYDIADIFKFETCVSSRISDWARKPTNPERDVRLACRMFSAIEDTKAIIPTIAQYWPLASCRYRKNRTRPSRSRFPTRRHLRSGHRGENVPPAFAWPVSGLLLEIGPRVCGQGQSTGSRDVLNQVRPAGGR